MIYEGSLQQINDNQKYFSCMDKVENYIREIDTKCVLAALLNRSTGFTNSQQKYIY